MRAEKRWQGGARFRWVGVPTAPYGEDGLGGVL
jgi:hypothetical protein